MRPRTTAPAVILALALAVIGSSGCIANRLGQRAMHQASTLPELQYQQVLNNLALFADNPAALPWHVNFREGRRRSPTRAARGRPSTWARRRRRCRKSSAPGPWSSSGA